MKLYIFTGLQGYPVANDNFGGDGKRAKRHAYFN